MKKYHIVARELRVVDGAAWWNPRLRRPQGGAAGRDVFALELSSRRTRS